MKKKTNEGKNASSEMTELRFKFSKLDGDVREVVLHLIRRGSNDRGGGVHEEYSTYTENTNTSRVSTPRKH